jgi:predicted nucleic acid-binding protein
MIQNAEPFALTGIVVVEILQGLTRDISRIERFLFQWELIEPLGFSTYREAAEISRLARSRGISLKTVDTLIAAVAIENGAALFTLDKDFFHISRVSALSLHRSP